MHVRANRGRRFVWICVISCVLFTFANYAKALTERMLSIRESFDAADAVILAQIDDQEQLYEGNDRCGIRYTASVLENFKGGPFAKSNEFTFGRDVGLARYRTYLLFLHREADAASIYERLKEKFGFPDKRKNIMDLIRCKGTIPGYIFDPKTPWEVISGDVRIVGLRPDNIPPEIHVLPVETAVWLIPKHELFSYLRTLLR